MRANFQKNYLMRYLMFVGVCLPLSLWFFYDGFVGYPNQLPMTQAFDALRDLKAQERTDQWKAIARKNGWPTKEPEKTTEELKSDIIGQYIFGGLTALVACVGFAYYFRSRNSWIERTEKGITTSWGQSVDFSNVAKIDKKKWMHKGIATVTYMEKGKKKRFVFDDFKYDRQPLDHMLYEMEQTLRPEQIVGGPLEEAPAIKQQPGESESLSGNSSTATGNNEVLPSISDPISSP